MTGILVTIALPPPPVVKLVFLQIRDANFPGKGWLGALNPATGG
jgi:hypothetical protein